MRFMPSMNAMSEQRRPSVACERTFLRSGSGNGKEVVRMFGCPNILREQERTDSSVVGVYYSSKNAQKLAKTTYVLGSCQERTASLNERSPGSTTHSTAD